MAAISTTTLALPSGIAQGVWSKAQTGSVVARLSGQAPMLFGKSDVMTFTGHPKAEFVAEGAQKSETPATFAPKTVVPHKAQVTVRFSNEVMWADEDYQIGVLNELGDALSVALARALDLGALHGINPLTGAKAASITDYVALTTNKVLNGGTAPETEIVSAAGLVIADGFTPTGVAMDSAYHYKAVTATYSDGRRVFPELALDSSMQSFMGIPAAHSTTVNAANEVSAGTKVQAVVGDWSALRWGVQRSIGLKVIEYGDPDGLGDLQGHNQVALRAETVFGWAVLDANAFAVVTSASA